MKKQIVKLFFALVVLVVPLLYSVSINAEVLRAAKITAVTNWVGGGNESLLIKTNKAYINPASCSHVFQRQGYYILTSKSSDISRVMVMSAKLQELPIDINVWSGGCSSEGIPVIVSLQF